MTKFESLSQATDARIICPFHVPKPINSYLSTQTKPGFLSFTSST